MGRVLQSLVAVGFLFSASSSDAYDFYQYADNSYHLDPHPSFHDYTCNYSTYIYGAPYQLSSYGGVTAVAVSMPPDAPGGCITEGDGSAFTCNAPKVFNGSTSAPMCVTSPTCPTGTHFDAATGICTANPTCTSPNVPKPDGSCGSPCTSGVAATWGGAGGPAPSSVCVSYCNYNLNSSGSATNRTFNGGQVTVTARSASGVPESWSAGYKADGTTCQSNTSGVAGGAAGQIVSANHAVQCNMATKDCSVDGEKVNYTAIPNNTCIKTASGAGFCTMGADNSSTVPASPPAPNTGTAGASATPGTTITTYDANGNVTSVNSYSPTQVATSTTQPPRGDATAGVAGTGASAGGGAASTIGTQGNPSVEDCTKSGTCTSATNGGNTAAPTDAKDFGQSLSDFQAGVASSPIVSAFSGVGAGIPSGGTPPSANLSMFGHSYTLAVPDAVATPVTNILSLIMKAVWSLIAIRRFMAA